MKKLWKSKKQNVREEQDYEDLLRCFIDPKTDRYKHSIGVSERAKETCEKFGFSISSKLYNTALLHDIGYGECFIGNSSHGIKGYELLKNLKDVYAVAVKNHGTGVYDLDCTKTDMLVTKFLDYCDITTDFDGSKCTIQERIDGIELRHGKNSVQYNSVLKLRAYYLNIFLNIEYITKEIILKEN